MAFELQWTQSAQDEYNTLKKNAEQAEEARRGQGRSKSSKQEGLFKQVKKTIQLLKSNPKHPSLQTHEYSGLENPYNKKDKVLEAYAQNSTPGAYRVFWCYGKKKGAITILAITPHP